METLGVSVIPLAAFWAAFNSMLKAAEFVNSIRDSILSGMNHGANLSYGARKAMLYDWVLVMVGSVSSSLTFAGIMIWMGLYIHGRGGEVSSVGWAVGTAAVVPLLGSALFVLCGISDYRTMQEELAKEAGRV